MDLELTGKIALVSGASRGIGLSIAQLLSREGCTVAISARNLPDLEAAKKQIEGSCSIHVSDATDAVACSLLVDDVCKIWGRLDIVITNAGSGASVPPGQETDVEWQRVIALNFFSATNLIEAATPFLRKSNCASIVCISSICGIEALGAPATYSVAKAALNATVKNLARPLAQSGIRINAVSPGNILFPGGVWDRKMREQPEEIREMLEVQVPLACFGTPQSIADAVTFLASPRAAFITGANLVVDGGQTRGF